MKRMGKSIVVLLALALVLAACGNSSKDSDSGKPSAASGEAATQGLNDKITELNVVAISDRGEIKDLPVVQEAVNAHIQNLIHAKVNITFVSVGDYVQKANLMLTGNEKVDLMIVSPFFGFTSQVARGQLQPLDELVDKYGPDIKSVLGSDYLNAGKVNGKLYGVVPMKDMAGGTGLIMRKDLVDQYKIDIGKIKTLEDIGPVLKTIKDNEPDVMPLVPGATGASLLFFQKWYDELGDGNGVLPNYDNNLKVVNLFETPEYADQVKWMREWYTSGYIMKDAATTKEDHLELVKAGRAFAYFSPTKPGIDDQESNKTGTPMVSADILPPASTTSTVTSFMWAIPRNAGAPEKAMAFLNLMYKDKELVNLIDWGIEGKHYVKISDNEVDYPEGINGANTLYPMSMKFLFGNEFISYTQKGTDPDIWKKLDAFNKSAIKSKALGFSFDSTPVKTETAAVTNVINTYKNALEAGTLDPVQKLPEFIAKLKDAGMDKIIAEKQKQLDEWAKLTP